MKKYFVRVTQAIFLKNKENQYSLSNDNTYALLFDLSEPRLDLLWGLHFKVIDHSLNYSIFGLDNEGYMPIATKDDLIDQCKIVEFNSDEVAKLWFEMNYINI